MVQYIKDIINDEHNFFHIGTTICSIILLTIFITDAITTIKALSIGLHELNPIMKYIVGSPFLLIFTKILGAVIMILLIRNTYIHLKTMDFTKKYSDILMYIIFSLPSSITLAVVFNNFSRLYIHYL
jgi:hypothetical protein